MPICVCVCVWNQQTDGEMHVGLSGELIPPVPIVCIPMYVSTMSTFFIRLHASHAKTRRWDPVRFARAILRARSRLGTHKAPTGPLVLARLDLPLRPSTFLRPKRCRSSLCAVCVACSRQSFDTHARLILPVGTYTKAAKGHLGAKSGHLVLERRNKSFPSLACNPPPWRAQKTFHETGLGVKALAASSWRPCQNSQPIGQRVTLASGGECSSDGGAAPA
jgi:hypothetical protein